MREENVLQMTNPMNRLSEKMKKRWEFFKWALEDWRSEDGHTEFMNIMEMFVSFCNEFAAEEVARALELERKKEKDT